jgi:hypothetical protein
MPDLPPPPSQADIDALFAEARRARVLDGGARGGKPMGSEVLASFDADELPALRDALRIIEGGPPIHCMCYGDLAIELRGRLLRVGVISYHHGVSVRVEGAFSDANLIDGQALLRLLAARGVTGPLERFEAGEREQARLNIERGRWEEATPKALRESRHSLASGPMGLPPHERDAVFDSAITALRASGDADQTIAAELFAWLGTSHSPWSGYPAHEQTPLVLLRRLNPEAALAALLAAENDEALLGAARYAADHETVSFRKRFLRQIPDKKFADFARRLAQVPMTADGLADAKARLAQARAIATASRERASELASQRDRELACVAISDDGPFAALVTDGQTLAAVDVYTVVRIDPEQGALTALTTYEGSPFTDLVFVGGTLLAMRGNEGRVDKIALDGSGRSVFASELARPLRPVDSGGVLCFISAPFEDNLVNGIRYSVQRTSLVRAEEGKGVEPILPVEAGVSALAADATHLYYYASTKLDGEGAIYRVARSGGKAKTLANVGRLGHAVAQPGLIVAGDHLVFADGPALRRVPAAGGEVTTLHRASAPIGAVAAVSSGYVLIVGDMSEESWEVLRLPSDKGKPQRLGALSRRPYHRLTMVVRRGEAFFTLDDRLYRVR